MIIGESWRGFGSDAPEGAEDEVEDEGRGGLDLVLDSPRSSNWTLSIWMAWSTMS